MLRTLTPADLAATGDGAIFSARYGDVYASRDGALGQARHVFLGGNDLPARWATLDQFVIFETGFGLGANFLATWHAWRADPARPRRLHYVSVEAHPVAAEQMRSLARAEHAPLAQELAAAWPVPLPGLHRREFEDGALVLTLAFGDAGEVVPRLACGADALFLDGFAPDRNPDMWAPALLKAIARLARPGATLATWCTARAVRDALAEAGFELELRAGFGRKRQMLAGRYAPRWRVRRHEPPSAYRGERSAIVIGAGLAGANVAHSLARRGWHVHVLERERAPAARASALPWGLMYPQITADDSVLARLTRAGFFASRHALSTLAVGGCGERVLWQPCGVFRQARDAAQAAAWAAVQDRGGLPPQFARWIDADEAERRVGVRPLHGGWWFGDGALVSAAAWCAQALAPASITLRCGRPVDRLERDGDAWVARAADGRALGSAPVVVVASALDAPRLLREATTAVPVRGRITQIESSALASLRAGLTGDGYLVRGPDGWAGVGATYETPMPGDEKISALDDARAQAGNLARLPRLLAVPPQAKAIGGFDELRCVARDHLPCAGAVADGPALHSTAARLRGAHPRDLPRQPGLFASYALGSRGLSLAALAAERIAAQIEGEPEPIERDLGDAIDPARGLLRALRRGSL